MHDPDLRAPRPSAPPDRAGPPPRPEDAPLVDMLRAVYAAGFEDGRRSGREERGPLN